MQLALRARTELMARPDRRVRWDQQVQLARTELTARSVRKVLRDPLVLTVLQVQLAPRVRTELMARRDRKGLRDP